MSQFPPSLPPNQGQPLQYATPAAYHPSPDGVNLHALAVAQRRVMWVILGAILMVISLVGSAAVTPTNGIGEYVAIGLLMLVRIAILVCMMIAVFQLSKALGNGTGTNVLFVIAMIIPCVSLVVLLVLNQKATGIFKRANIRVGLMGANMNDLPRGY